jgi:hypothetical protein
VGSDDVMLLRGDPLTTSPFATFSSERGLSYRHHSPKTSDSKYNLSHAAATMAPVYKIAVIQMYPKVNTTSVSINT